MNRLNDEIVSLKSNLASPDTNIDAGEAVKSLNHLKSKVSQLEEDFPASCLSLAVASSSDQMAFLTHTIRAAVYLKTPLLDPHHYSLDLSSMFSPTATKESMITLRLHCTMPTRQSNPLVLSKLVLSMHCPDGSHFHNKRVLEEGTVSQLIQKKKAFVSTPSSVMIQIKKPRDLVVNIEVKLLESDILHSPRVISFLSPDGANDSRLQDMTRLDITGTGQLCRADLDMTELDVSRLPQLPIAGSNNSPSQDTPNTVWTGSAHPTTPPRYLSAEPFGSPHSPLQPTGPTPPKIARQSSNIPTLPADPSNCLPYFSPLDTSNPHLLLNASLAPGCQTLNATYLPDPCWDDSMWSPSPPSPSKSMAANTTMWDVASSPPHPGLFLSSKLECECVYTSSLVSLSKSRTTSVLTSPYDITFFQPPGMDGFYIVTEPLHDRVGVYSHPDMTYLGQLGNGHLQFQYPTSVLTLSCGELVLVERNKLTIVDKECKRLVVTLTGKYNGLAEGENGDIFTLAEGRKIVRLVKVEGRYSVKEKILLNVVEGFDEWYSLSKPRHLLYNMGRLYISDKGLHKLLLIDLSTAQQTASGYLGEGVGQFKRPTGMVADAEGNMLVVDQGNNRVLLYNSSGNCLRVGIHGQMGLEQPCCIAVCKGDLIVVYRGKDGRGGVVKYKLEV